MKKYKFTNQAFMDLEDIWIYHADYDEGFADLVKSLIMATANKIADAPFSYQKRGDLILKPYRFCVLSKYSYYIIYNPNSEPVEILRVVSSKRDITSLL